MKNIIYISLKSAQPAMINDKHSFELYGYDILIEDNMKPWLIEVNASPSVSHTTEADYMLKMELLKNVFDIVVPSDWTENCEKHGIIGANTCKDTENGTFTLLIDET